MSEEVTIKIRKENIWKYTTFILAAVLIIGAFVTYGGSNGNSQPTTNTQTQNAATQTGPTQSVTVAVGDAPVLGAKNSKLTIVEFSDFSCPYCGVASGDNPQYAGYYGSDKAPVAGMMEDYVKTGKAQFALKYFPGHGSGQQAQLVGWCLYDQSPAAFWKYYNKVFAVQDKSNDLAAMKALAVELGGDSKKIDSCISAKTYDSRLDSETSEGRNLGVSGTPSFFINGKQITGACPYSTFDGAIKAELAGQEWSVDNQCKLATY